MLISGNEPDYFLCDILHSLIPRMGFFYLGYFPSRSIWHFAFCSFLGLVLPVANDRLEVCEGRIRFFGCLMAHLVFAFIPEVTDEDYFCFWRFLVDIANQLLEVFLIGIFISHILAKLNGNQSELLTQQLIQEWIGILTSTHQLPGREIVPVADRLTFRLPQIAHHPAEIIAIRLRRADAASPTADQRQAVADGQVVAGIIAILGLEIIVFRGLIQLIPEEAHLPHQFAVFLFLLLFMFINLIAHYPPMRQMTTSTDIPTIQVFFRMAQNSLLDFIPCSCFLIPLLDDARRAAYGDALGRDVVGDGGVATDDAAVADGDAGQDCGELTDPDIVLDDDGLAGRQGTLGWWHIGAVGMGAAVDAVVVVGDVNLAAHEDVVADLDTVNAADVDVLAEAHVVADDKVRREVLFVPGFAVRVDGLHPEASTR